MSTTLSSTYTKPALSIPNQIRMPEREYDVATANNRHRIILKTDEVTQKRAEVSQKAQQLSQKMSYKTIESIFYVDTESSTGRNLMRRLFEQ